MFLTLNIKKRNSPKPLRRSKLLSKVCSDPVAVKCRIHAILDAERAKFIVEKVGAFLTTWINPNGVA